MMNTVDAIKELKALATAHNLKPLVLKGEDGVNAFETALRLRRFMYENSVSEGADHYGDFVGLEIGRSLDRMVGNLKGVVEHGYTPPVTSLFEGDVVQNQKRLRKWGSNVRSVIADLSILKLAHQRGVGHKYTSWMTEELYTRIGVLLTSIGQFDITKD